jgi:hypothetical protein
LAIGYGPICSKTYFPSLPAGVTLHSVVYSGSVVAFRQFEPAPGQLGHLWNSSDSKTYFPYLPDSADLIKARPSFAR